MPEDHPLCPTNSKDECEKCRLVTNQVNEDLHQILSSFPDLREKLLNAIKAGKHFLFQIAEAAMFDSLIKDGLIKVIDDEPFPIILVADDKTEEKDEIQSALCQFCGISKTPGEIQKTLQAQTPWITIDCQKCNRHRGEIDVQKS